MLYSWFQLDQNIHWPQGIAVFLEFTWGDGTDTYRTEGKDIVGDQIPFCLISLSTLLPLHTKMSYQNARQ